MPQWKHAMLAFLLSAATVFPAVAADLGTQKTADRGVTVAVTPQNLSGGAATWEFKIVLDTHSQDLNDDLVKSAVLLAAGNEHKPVAWEGAPPGGHHREGALRFNVINPLPDRIELQIQRPGEAKPRMYAWNLR